MDSSGQIQNASLFKEAGFDLGHYVKRKADGEEGLIKAIINDRVLLTLEGSEKSCSVESFLKGEWKHSTPPSVPDMVSNWAEKSPGTNLDFWQSAIKAKLILLMYQSCGAITQLQVDVFSKPRMVKAAASFSAGKLKIPVATSRVDMRDDGKDVANGFCIGTSTKELHE